MTDSGDGWDELGRASFVSVGTFRSSGDVVRTPVWIAPLGDALVLTSEINTGKVRRLRRDDRAVLVACDRFGKIAPAAREVAATGAVVEDDETTEAALAALRKKYGLQVRLVLALERLVRRIQRRPLERTIISLTRA